MGEATQAQVEAAREAIMKALEWQNPDAQRMETAGVIRLSGGVTPQSSGCTIDVDDLARAVLELPASEAPAPVGADWVLVPREPTEAMIEAGDRGMTEAAEMNDIDDIPACWSAMLAAAPTPPLAAAPAPVEGDWPEIGENTPRDGSQFLAFCATAYTPTVFACWWSAGGWKTHSKPEEKRSGGVGSWFPTHWSPMPQTPAFTKPGGARQEDQGEGAP